MKTVVHTVGATGVADSKDSARETRPLTARQAAEFLGIPLRTFYNLKIPGHRYSPWCTRWDMEALQQHDKAPTKSRSGGAIRIIESLEESNAALQNSFRQVLAAMKAAGRRAGGVASGDKVIAPPGRGSSPDAANTPTADRSDCSPGKSEEVRGTDASQNDRRESTCLNARAAAKYLGLPVRTFYDLRIPGYRYSPRCTRWDVAELESYKQSRQFVATQPPNRVGGAENSEESARALQDCLNDVFAVNRHSRERQT